MKDLGVSIKCYCVSNAGLYHGQNSPDDYMKSNSVLPRG